jgi:Tfp pilus assembly PilM family ATPase
VGINVEPCAIVECFARLFRRSEDVTRATLFVDIGAASTQVVICHGPRLAFAKNLFVGGARLDQAVADGLRVPLDEAQRLRYRMTLGREQEKADEVQALLAGPAAALAEELTSCLRYYESVFANRPVERAVFLGGQAYDKRLCQALAKRLAVPAQIGDPLAGIQREPGSDHEDGAAAEGSQPEWAVAVGLSLGGAGGKSPLARQEEAVLS